ncbi:MAG: apolipoprotein N-acyltransferase [Burkholderiales bacterium]|nr:apolipoprotein N-acyltransferase [Burkholderiales bacterium]
MVAGVLNILAFAPFGWWPLQIILLALLFRQILDTPSVKHSALIGLAFGWGWMTCGVHWLYISMHRYGGMPSWMAVAAVAILGLFMGTFFGLATGGAAWLKKRWSLSPTLALLLIFPATWTLSEWIRGWIFTGFPWVASGYAHNTSPLAGYAPLIGIYGLGALAAFVAAALVLAASKRIIALAIVGVFAIGWGLQSISWTKPSGQPISVRLLQGNVPQELKFAPERLAGTLTEYDMLIRLTRADLIATPEVALPLLSNRLPPEYVTRLTDFANQAGSHILLGIPVSDGPEVYSNSALGFAPGGRSYRYDKHHLVPFGEFIPPGFRWFVDMMQIPLGDMTRGAPVQTPFQVKDQWVLPNICYEDLFGEEIADQIAAGYFGTRPQPTMLLNMSNIAWFGDSIALPQHRQISQMRAIETGRPMLRATNTGATAIITPNGKVAAELPPFEKGVLTATVQGYTGVTPYVVVGNRAIVLLTLICLGLAYFLSRKNAQGSPKTR